MHHAEHYIQNLENPQHHHVRNLVILAFAVLLPRFVVIAYSIAPARDSLRFVEAAQTLTTQPFDFATRSMQTHPGYPLTLLAARKLYVSIGGAPGAEGWIRAGQLWSLTCYLLFLYLAYAAGNLLWNERIAFIGCLGASVLPRPMSYTVDVLSDNLHALLWMTSFLLLIWHWRSPSLWKPLLSGLFAGLAYWTRLEALLLPCLFLGAWTMTQLWPTTRRPWAYSFAALLAFALPFGLLAGSYMNMVGGLSVRKVAGTMTGTTPTKAVAPVTQELKEENTSPTVAAASPAPRTPSQINGKAQPEESLVPVSTKTSALELDQIGTKVQFANRELRGYEKTSFLGSLSHLAKELGEETRIWVLAFLAVAILLPRQRTLRFPEGLLLLFAVVGICALLVLMKMRAGYMAGRYALPILPFLAMGAVSGILGLVTLFQRLPRFPWERSWSPAQVAKRRNLAGTLSVVALVTALCLPRWLRPLHESHYAHMEAAYWLKSHSNVTDQVFDHAGMSAFFAERSAWRPDTSVPRCLPIRFAILDAGLLERTEEPELTVIAHIHEQGRLVQSFPKKPGSSIPGVYLFEIPAQQATAPTTPAERR